MYCSYAVFMFTFKMGNWQNLGGAWLFLPLDCIIIILCLYTGFFSKKLRNKYCVWIGNISMEAYFWHVPILSVLLSVFHHMGILTDTYGILGDWVRIGLSFLITLLCSSLYRSAVQKYKREKIL